MAFLKLISCLMLLHLNRESHRQSMEDRQSLRHSREDQKNLRNSREHRQNLRHSREHQKSLRHSREHRKSLRHSRERRTNLRHSNPHTVQDTCSDQAPHRQNRPSEQRQALFMPQTNISDIQSLCRFHNQQWRYFRNHTGAAVAWSAQGPSSRRINRSSFVA